MFPDVPKGDRGVVFGHDRVPEKGIKHDRGNGPHRLDPVPGSKGCFPLAGGFYSEFFFQIIQKGIFFNPVSQFC